MFSGLVLIPFSAIRPNLVPTQSPSRRLRKAIYWVVKIQAREFNRSPSSSAEVNTDRSISQLPISPLGTVLNYLSTRTNVSCYKFTF
jgi:hypothetical protein